MWLHQSIAVQRIGAGIATRFRLDAPRQRGTALFEGLVHPNAQ